MLPNISVGPRPVTDLFWQRFLAGVGSPTFLFQTLDVTKHYFVAERTQSIFSFRVSRLWSELGFKMTGFKTAKRPFRKQTCSDVAVFETRQKEMEQY